jgi:ABC-type lipoprotein export system ATPase subunit
MIEIKHLNKTYDRGRKTANRVLKDVSFTLPDTGFVCILGPSGCGKTSLLNAIGGLDDFDNGTLATENVTVKRSGTVRYEAERNRSFGYIFQNYYLLEKHSAAYNVYLGLHSLKLTHREKLRRVKQALEAVDMGRYARRQVGELSGGQQQRIAIARALARRPRVIFADEPTGNLDDANTRNICALLRKASKDSLVVMVTHEAHIARFFADRIITLDQGRIAEDTTQWDRSSLSLGSDKVLYSGDYQEHSQESNGVHLRLLRT